MNNKLKQLEKAQNIINSLDITSKDISDDENRSYAKFYVEEINNYIEGIIHYFEVENYECQ